MADGQPVPGSLYIYGPNRILPIVFAVAFALSAAGHLWQCYRHSCFKLTGLQLLCAIVFAAGYVLREVGAFNYGFDTPSIIIFILSQGLIYVCPPLLELSNYHIFGRILFYIPYHAPLPPRRLLSIFGALMVVIEALNALGIALVSNRSSSHSTQEIGRHLTLASLVLQLGLIVVFMVLTIIFHRRCVRAKVEAKAIPALLIAMYISMSLILTRSVYRTVEHFGSTTIRLDDFESLRHLTPMLRYEWYFYVLEGVTMLINSILWNVWHPGRYLPRETNVYLAGRTEINEGKRVDDRIFWAKCSAGRMDINI